MELQEQTTPKDVFLASLARCLQTKTFLARFYERFVASSDEIARMFWFTDFERQHAMLQRSLELVAAATVGDPEGLAELSQRAETHGPGRLNIRRELYDLWSAAAIATARECDEAWDAATDEAWQVILGFAIRRMTRSAGPRMAPDQRRSPRVMCGITGGWRSAAGRIRPCVVGDIGAGGCFVHSAFKPEPAERVAITLAVTGRPGVTLDGTVVRSDGDGFSLKFDQGDNRPHPAEFATLLRSLGLKPPAEGLRPAR